MRPNCFKLADIFFILGDVGENGVISESLFITIEVEPGYFPNPIYCFAPILMC